MEAFGKIGIDALCYIVNIQEFDFENVKEDYIAGSLHFT